MKSAAIKRFSKLAQLYEHLEKAAAATLARENLKVNEVEAALQKQNQLISRRSGSSSNPFSHEGALEWLMCESERACARINTTRLDALLEKLLDRRDISQEHHQKALLERNQIMSLVENAKSAAQYELDRAEQYKDDDRYLSRNFLPGLLKARKISLS